MLVEAVLFVEVLLLSDEVVIASYSFYCFVRLCELHCILHHDLS